MEMIQSKNHSDNDIQLDIHTLDTANLKLKVTKNNETQTTDIEILETDVRSIRQLNEFDKGNKHNALMEKLRADIDIQLKHNDALRMENKTRYTHFNALWRTVPLFVIRRSSVPYWDECCLQNISKTDAETRCLDDGMWFAKRKHKEICSLRQNRLLVKKITPNGFLE
eukprot:gene15089-32012_t